MASSLKHIGKSYLRKEGPDKLTGRSRYIDDIKMDGILHGVTIRSTIARGKIKNVRFKESFDWSKFVIVTAKDIPGKNEVALIVMDQPYLASEMINHPEEPILLVAHPEKHMAEEARNQIEIEYQEMPAVFTIDDSLSKKHIVWGKDNIQKEFTIEKGNVTATFKNAEHVIEGNYETGAQEQLYIENNGVIAVASPQAGVTVWGSMQCPYYVHKGMLPLFNLPPEQVRIIQTETGGGFGGKEEYPTLIAGHAALLSWKAGGRPVKLVYDRMEDMAATTKRHPSKTRIKTSVRKDGKILGAEIDFTLDGGAYVTLSPVVLSRGGIHAAGPYSFPNVFVRARAVATNCPPHGAFRGFGAPQSIFAMERHLDVVAQKLGISAEEIRKINFVKDGETTSTGQVMKDHVHMDQLLDRALKEANYHQKMKKFEKENKNSHIKRGMGFATFFHGAGFTGSGERYMASVAGVDVNIEGKVRVLASSTEIGQGTNTVFSQIAAETLKLPFHFIEVARPDTGVVPNSGPTVASRTVMIVGKLVEKACENLKSLLVHSGVLNEKYSEREWQAACAEYIQKFGPLKAYSQYKQPANIQWDEIKYKGDAYATYAWGVYVADVAVDTLTFETQVKDFVALQEIGKVVHPTLAEGQIEGGVAQAIGYALYEKVVWKDGKMINNTMTNYIMPTSMDLPPIRVFFEEVPQVYGPAGAKGIGELPMDGAAPAILNAVQKAIGVSVNAIPMTPEDLMRAMQ